MGDAPPHVSRIGESKACLQRRMEIRQRQQVEFSRCGGTGAIPASPHDGAALIRRQRIRVGSRITRTYPAVRLFAASSRYRATLGIPRRFRAATAARERRAERAKSALGLGGATKPRAPRQLPRLRDDGGARARSSAPRASAATSAQHPTHAEQRQHPEPRTVWARTRGGRGARPPARAKREPGGTGRAARPRGASPHLSLEAPRRP
jgi:hypothetical protein